MVYFRGSWGISCRAGSGKVSTASGLSLFITSATVSGLVVPSPLLTDVGADVSKLPPVILHPVGILFPFFGGTSAFPYV